MYGLAWSRDLFGYLGGSMEPHSPFSFCPPISHLFFADDLAIFSKADMKHSRLIRNILGRFCDFSWHKINVRKTNIFSAKGLDVIVADSNISLFGFQKVQNLGHYLSVPLFHLRMTNGTMHFVVKKVRRKLQSWDAKRLSIVGRITLAQSILMSIPRYFMQSMMITRSICDEIESLVK
ncbi:Retrovirus-related Pol polyprotein LINE-1 [Gossypium australe]|uniref:Retrovirus-related Pol polyprotein LINE-1 n=1 Tax=Gossypium australe TaxID=47621 RepID=A0A5B6W2V9_9ROSI|nr:Retrovirus-related Pol polyprotein LINE-1 [Gossypium australe]